MLWFSPKLPVDNEERLWVDEGFARLEKMLGRSRLLDARVILPNPEYFPTHTTGARPQRKYFSGDVRLHAGGSATSKARDLSRRNRGTPRDFPLAYRNRPHAAGVYIRDGATQGDGDWAVIALRSTLLKEPFALVATIAHELGHVILLGGGHMDRNMPDHEPMTDLLTVFLGLGIFSANSAARFKQYSEAGWHGWSMQRLGYLPQEVYGYALARLAAERGERKPEWIRHLSTNVRVYFKRSRAWLAKNANRAA